MNKNKVNLFFACDDTYIPFLAVTLLSIKDHRDASRTYDVKILNTGIDEEAKNRIITTLCDKGFNIDFHDISSCVERISEKLHTRDYYSKSTYFRLFIPELYHELDRALYLDCDIILKSDVALLYDTDLGDNLVAAAPDDFVLAVDRLHGYVTKRVGVCAPHEYFNAGVLLMNLAAMRDFEFEKKFTALLSAVKFKVAQDQDYLNALCKEKRTELCSSWNCMPGFSHLKTKAKLIHYNLDSKPWHKDDVEYSDDFWYYADRSPFASEIREVRRQYKEQKKSEEETSSLIDLAEAEADDEIGNLTVREKITSICK